MPATGLPVASESLAAASRWFRCGGGELSVEDSIYLGPGQLAKSNAEQVTKIRNILTELSLDVATPEEARAMLKLKGGDKVAF